MATKSKRARGRNKNLKGKARDRVGKEHTVSESRSAWWRRILFVAIFVVGAAFATYFSAWDVVSKLLWKPDIALTFSHPKMALVSVWNISSAVVQKPQYAVNLLNVDEGVTPPNFLPIPTHLGDGAYIQPRSRLGPNEMFDSTQVKAHLKEGDRLIGWAYVMCPECPRHDYIVYIKHGIEGWYAKLNDGDFVDMDEIAKSIKDPQALFASFMSSVAEERRIPIIGSPYSPEAVPLALRKKIK